MLLEVEDALGTLVEQQVEDAEVRQEAVALRAHLIIRCGVEVGVGQRMLRAYCLAEVDKVSKRFICKNISTHSRVII